jgi:hypothetical protein
MYIALVYYRDSVDRNTDYYDLPAYLNDEGFPVSETEVREQEIKGRPILIIEAANIGDDCFVSCNEKLREYCIRRKEQRGIIEYSQYEGNGLDGITMCSL